MDWPLRFNSQGMIIGRFGEPRRPIVEAIGMPISMCVAWISPFASASRMAAQLAPLLTVELMPYFLKKPFSCAMTIGEQSVRAIMPNLRSLTSGPSLGDRGPGVAPPTVGAAVLESQPLSRAAAARPVTEVDRKLRRLLFSLSCIAPPWGIR